MVASMSEQLERWRGDFGDEYIGRNTASPGAVADAAVALATVLGRVQPAPRSILEVGANIGINLRALRFLTTADLWAVEPNSRARQSLVDDGVVVSDHALDGHLGQLPLPDSSVDIAFTRGVLIHVPDSQLDRAYDELYRVSGRYVLSMEYFSQRPEQVTYRGHDDMLFKRDYGSIWIDRFPALQYVANGFFWRRTTGLDDLNWWLFKKPEATGR